MSTSSPDQRRRVAVTAAGQLGRAVVRHLRESGWDVLALDRRTPDDDGEFLAVDLTDYGQVLPALSGGVDEHGPVEAVVHLAAIRAPGLVPNAATFANNVPSTYNVFSACRAAVVISYADSTT